MDETESICFGRGEEKEGIRLIYFAKKEGLRLCAENCSAIWRGFDSESISISLKLDREILSWRKRLDYFKECGWQLQ
jgi:hypothetical protein